MGMVYCNGLDRCVRCLYLVDDLRFSSLDMFKDIPTGDFRRGPHFYLSEPVHGVGDLLWVVRFLTGRVFCQNGNLKTAHWYITHRIDYDDNVLTVQYERIKDD